MSGRPKFEDTLNKDKLAGWQQMLEDVHSGRTPLNLAAESWHTSSRTIQRSLEARKEQLLAATRYEKASKFIDVPGVKDFFLSIDANLKTELAKIARKRGVEQLWANPEVFDKKPLSMLTKQDFQKAIIWCKKQAKNTSYTWLIHLRSFVLLGGFGKHEWLKAVMPTGGYKAPREIPVEMRDEQSWKQITPRLMAAVAKMAEQRMISAEEREVFEFMFHTKRLEGPRTGNHLGTTRTSDPVDREMWGLRLNTGENRIDYLNGKIREWVYFCKKEEVWRISREESEFYAPGLADYTEAYIQRRGIKDGDYLIPESFKRARGRIILHEACKVAGISDMILHDLRALFFTGLILAGVPMEVAVDLGVGWKKMDVPKQFYLTIKGANTKKWLPAVQKFLTEEGQGLAAPA